MTPSNDNHPSFKVVYSKTRELPTIGVIVNGAQLSDAAYDSVKRIVDAGRPGLSVTIASPLKPKAIK